MTTVDDGAAAPAGTPGPVAIKPAPYSPQALALLAQKAASAFDDSVLPVPSPCISVCRMNEDRSLCTGCLRSLDEIRAWSGAGAGERRAIWRRLLARVAEVPAAS